MAAEVPKWIVAIANRSNILDMPIVGDSWRSFVSEDDMMSWSELSVEERTKIIVKADQKFKDTVNQEWC